MKAQPWACYVVCNKDISTHKSIWRTQRTGMCSRVSLLLADLRHSMVHLDFSVWFFLFNSNKLMYSSFFSFLHYVISDSSIWFEFWCLFSFVVVFRKLVLDFVTILSSIVALNFVVIFNRNKNGEEEDFVINFFLLIWKRGTFWIEIARCETKGSSSTTKE